jgi:hypothetical protein
VLWFENKADGSFIEHLGPEASGYTVAIVHADFDLDGDYDVFAAEYDSDSAYVNQFFIYENVGGNVFAPRRELFAESIYCQALRTIDMDGDQDLDLVIRFQRQEPIQVYENLGNLQFQKKQECSPSVNHGETLDIVDLDGDGDDDILANRNGRVNMWFANDGTGNFAEGQTISNGAFLARLSLPMDVDLDGDIDLIRTTGTLFGGEILVYLNSGAGSFDLPFISYNLGWKAESLFAADFDQDGDFDLMLSGERYSMQNYWLENDGLGNFSQLKLMESTSRFSGRILAADLNNDSYPDPIGQSGFHLLGWNENLQNGSFSDLKAIASQIRPSQVLVEDFSGDGKLDLLTTGSILQLGKGKGLFDLGKSLPPTGYGAGTIACGDFDGDSDLDLVTTTGSKFSWSENLGNGEFGPQQPVDASHENSPNFLSSADFDQDGRDDLLCHLMGSKKISWYRSNEAGSFDRHHILGGVYVNVKTAIPFDLNQDGKVDVIAGTSDLDQIGVFFNHGAGVFDISPTVLADGVINPTKLTAYDLDDDGDDDLLFATEDATLNWMECLGGQDFAAPLQIHIFETPIHSIDCADWNKSGSVDVVVGLDATGESTIQILAGDGSGGFHPPQQIGPSGEFAEGKCVAFVDLDEDGDVDLLASKDNHDRLYWYQNTHNEFLEISSTDFQAARVATLEIQSSQPFAMVWIGYSLTGAGPTTTLSGELLLSTPYYELIRKRVNQHGYKAFPVFVPPQAFGHTVWLNARDEDQGIYSNGLMQVVQ